MRVKGIILLSLLWLSSEIFGQEKLIFAIDLIRHGDRTPLRSLDKAPTQWKEGLGQLTTRGMYQEFDLGKKLRKKYVEEFALLPAKYEPQTIYVRSTDYDRTLMSAQSLLMGLYPVGSGPLEGFQPVPIHSVSAENDELLQNEVLANKVNEILEKRVYTQPDWQAKNAKVLPSYKRWSEVTGFPIYSLRDIIKLGDVLYIYQLHQVAMPKGLSKEDIQQIIDTGKWAMAKLYQNQEMGDLLGKSEIALINRYLQDASQHKNKLKYVLLSAHDNSILSLMSALGAPLSSPPGYAAHLSFALFEKQDKTKYIAIHFNEQPIRIPACGNAKCPLEKWTATFS